MEVIWTDPALADVETIYDYIVRFHPPGAYHVVAALREAGDSLAVFPYRGRPVSANVRELAAVHPYIIRYRVGPESVLILRVRHGMRRPG
ncbi:MAG TPA: type II toxin-antitoxin system RelE/ParE family toxin [Azospirillaceae bacterium]|nr:type II toxin-antitoxin system RelE/ParE family toxin [Azospirillaceae bacterium]